jgi:hypothetical protein
MTLSAAGTPVTEIRTPWGATATVQTASDSSVTVWGEHTATLSATVNPVGDADSGAVVGQLVATVDGADYPVELTLADDLIGPDIGWRLANPLALVG